MAAQKVTIQTATNEQLMNAAAGYRLDIKFSGFKTDEQIAKAKKLLAAVEREQARREAAK